MEDIKAYKVHMGAADCAVDLGDGSERGEYVNQDYILHKLGRPHRGISLMYCYYPLDKEFPARISEACRDMEVSFAWDYPYDDYFTLPSGMTDGKYTMKISPYSYFAPRTYEVTVKNGKLTADPDVTLYLRGDASCDGTINTLDLMAIKKHIINYSALKEPNLSCADLDVNGKVDLLDVSKLKKHLIGIEKLY